MRGAGVKLYNITYTGWLNFLIWFLPNQSLKKSVELGIRKGFVAFKSDKYEGTAKEINVLAAFIVRYSFVFIMILMLFPRIYWGSATFWFSTVLAMIIAGGLVVHVMFYHKTTFVYLLCFWVAILALFVLYYFFNSVFSSFMLFGLTTIRTSLFWYLILISILDFYAMKKKRFFRINEKRIIFYV